MTNSDSSFQKKEVILILCLALVAMTLITIAVIPQWRTSVKDLLITDSREVIAKLNGSLSAQGPNVTILKIKNNTGISLEVYFLNQDEGMVLMAKLPLYETRDGYFLLQGNATNLALTDVDKDGNPEIVAPTYDEQMVPRLNIFKFNPGTKSFDRMTAPKDFKP